MTRSIQIYDDEERNMYIYSAEDKFFHVKEDELEYLKLLERDYSPEHIQDSHILKTFPQAKSIIKKKIKALNQYIADLNSHSNKIKEICYTKIENIIEREKYEELFLDWQVNLPKKNAEERLKKYQSMINWSCPVSKTSRQVLDIQKANAYPITDLLKFNQAGFCLCPYHEEKTGSMKYYHKTNTVFCFGCQKSADAIDVAQKVYNLNFKEAVNKLM